MIIITKYNYLFFNHNNNINSIKKSIPQEPNDRADKATGAAKPRR